MVKLWKNEAAAWRIVPSFGSDEHEPPLGQASPVEHTPPAGHASQPELGIESGSGGGLVLRVKLGRREDLTCELVKRAAARAVKFLYGLGVRSAVLDADELAAAVGTDAVSAAAQGAELCLYRQTSYGADGEKKRSESEFELYINLGTHDGGAERALAEGGTLIKSIIFARELVNCPANILTPETMAERMTAEAAKVGIEARVLDMDEARALGMEAFLTVGSSAAHPARLIVLRYFGGSPDQKPIALVGKGVTCDTGGYCLKSAGSMKGIKGDMAGGAAVCGALIALAREHVPVNAVAVIPAAENRIAPDSYIPGDVIRTMSGKTVEILNTDAEGRLMLADAVTYAVRCENAAYIVDIATLTGAVVNMFGFTTAGYITNDEKFNAEFEAAFRRSGEQYWRLPDFPEYGAMIAGRNADLANSSSGGCGTITAGLFVGAFAEDRPWLHLDIAGTAWVDSPCREYQTVGATGAGAATLYELCKRLSNT